MAPLAGQLPPGTFSSAAASFISGAQVVAYVPRLMKQQFYYLPSPTTHTYLILPKAVKGEIG